MPIERILITVKTYPTLSQKYGELVCTAGIRPDGTWVRLYPVPFRRLDEPEQYAKFDWVDAELVKNRSDPRPETHRLLDMSALHIMGHMGTEDSWRKRRQLVLQTAKVYTRLQTLIEDAKSNSISLAVFRPTKILGFEWEEQEREWNTDKIAKIQERTQQGELFSEEAWRQTFKIIPKLPYSFSYRFEDESGQTSTMQVLDWEVGALFWNCLRNSDQNEQLSLEKVKTKYLDQFLKTDLHFFLGTTQQFHFVAPNPWVIVGVFPIPTEIQLSLL